ncbi:hypothetical protein l11_09920 [Neisseria weaveri LMG 5135]|nr:hypothetical protein l13_15190 [Neisseria weaveri ATCC 51223]EGV37751.1 hypothetical protein l11_09920 [Neisseria weaveri LMG 5135]
MFNDFIVIKRPSENSDGLNYTLFHLTEKRSYRCKNSDGMLF